MAAGADGTTGCGTGRRRTAVRKVGRDGRRARPCLISRLVDRRPDRRHKPGTRLRHLRPMRRGHVPGERDDDPYQQRADCGREPRPTAGTEEPSRSRPSMHSISPWHGTGAYHRAEATRALSPEGNRLARTRTGALNKGAIRTRRTGSVSPRPRASIGDGRGSGGNTRGRSEVW